MSVFMRYYFGLIHRGRYVWIAFWLICLIISAIFGLKFLDVTRDAFDAPKGTAAYDASQTFRADFPEQADLHPMVVLVSSLRNESVLTTRVSTSRGVGVLADVLYQYICGDLANSAWANPQSEVNCISYFKYNGTDYKDIAPQFVNPDHTITMILINYRFYDRIVCNDLIKHVRDLMRQVGNPDDNRWKIGLTGTDVLFLDTTEETAADMIRMDSIVLPIAFLVLSCYLKSFRLLIIPFLSVATSILTSFAIMYPIADRVFNVAAFAPSVMMSLVIAMSIDYSLFLLTRYREEILAGHSDIDSVFNMLRHAGHVVFVSGSTLVLSFMGLCFFPFDFLRSVGVGCCLALSLTMFVNLTLTPALLLATPNFFHNFSLPRCLHRVLPASFLDDVPQSKNIDESESDLDAALLDSGASSSGSGPGSGAPGGVGVGVGVGVGMSVGMDGEGDSESAHDKARQKQLKSFWYRSAKLSTTTLYSVLLLLAVLAVSLPSCVQVLKMKHTMDNTQLFPREAPSLIAFKELTAPGAFSPGLLGPFQIIVTSNAHNGINNDKYFNATQQVIRGLFSLFPLDLFPSDIRAISYLATGEPGIDPYISYENSQLLLKFGLPVYKYVYANATNSGLSASIITIATRFDPLSEQAEPFVKQTRLMLEQFTTQYQNTGAAYGFYITGSTTDEIDNVNSIFGLFPIMIIATTGAVFLVVMLIFRSLLVPLRAIVTIGLAIAVTYGFATLVFQQHKFDWTSSHLKEVNSLFWLTPIMSFSILVGLGLDYDIFLFSRIVEYRRAGFTDRAAILKGVYKTGGIITGAGIIMAISFGGLMLSSEMVLNQFGFLLCLAVLFDTFVVRTLLVPAIIHLAGKANWWPGGMPAPYRDELDQNDLDEEPATGYINDIHQGNGMGMGMGMGTETQAQLQGYTFANSRNTSPK